MQENSVRIEPGTVRFSASTQSLSNVLPAAEIWTKSKPAKQALISLITGLYAVLLVILAFAFEIAAISVNRVSKLRYEPFFIYLYVTGIAFLIFCQCFLLKPYSTSRRPLSRFFWNPWSGRNHSRQKKLNHSQGKEENCKMSEDLSEKRTVELTSEFVSSKRRATYSAPSAGSLYLRLGAIAFGTVAIIDKFMDIYFIFDGGDIRCVNWMWVSSLLLATTFIFIQLYFIFENSKLVIHRYKILGKFGVMHLVGTNLCIWIKAVVLEEAHMLEGVREELEVISSAVSNATSMKHPHKISHREVDHRATIPGLMSSTVTYLQNETSLAAHGLTQPSPMCSHDNPIRHSKLALSMKQFMTTCLIEHSLICAAVMFVIWMNIGSLVSHRVKHRKHNIRVDCSGADLGLFAGLLFVVATIVSMIIFFVQMQERDNRGAIIVLYISDIVLYVCSIIACLIAVAKMKGLAYSEVIQRQKEKALLIDDILLFVALVGQLLFSIFGIVALEKFSPLVALSVSCNGLRLVQVLIQTVLIFSAQRLAATTEASQKRKPGRQIITFLLIVNIALWLINTFESQKASSDPVMLEFYGQGPWYIIVHGTVPLTIFYRFHSSVCLAEIWKDCYKATKPDYV